MYRGHQTDSVGLYLLEVGQRPGPIEVGLGRLVEPEIREPVLAGPRRDPVLLEASRRRGPRIDVHRTVLVLAQVHAGRAISDVLFIQDERTRVDVVDRDRPE